MIIYNGQYRFATAYKKNAQAREGKELLPSARASILQSSLSIIDLKNLGHGSENKNIPISNQQLLLSFIYVDMEKSLTIKYMKTSRR